MDTTEANGGTTTDPCEECIIIASVCNLVLRSKYLKPETIELIPAYGYKHSTKAMEWLKYMHTYTNSQNGGEQEVEP